jgi:hypothetical protein
MKIPPVVGGGLVLLIVIGIWGVMFFRSNSRPNLLPELAGCYRGPATLVRREVRVRKSGEMSSGSVKVAISINLDKVGISFLPTEKIVMNLVGDSGIVMRSGYPSLLRIADDHRSFLVPDENGPDVRFDRVACDNTSNQTKAR